jgi:hypothetical protein
MVFGTTHTLGLPPEKDRRSGDERYMFGVVFGPFVGLLLGGDFADDLEIGMEPEGALRRIWPVGPALVWSPAAPRVGVGDLDLARIFLVRTFTPDVELAAMPSPWR